MSIIAYIPAGGEAIRLRPHSLLLPKPIMPMGSKRVIDFALSLSCLFPETKKVIVATNNTPSIALPVEDYVKEIYPHVEIVRDKKRYQGAVGLLDCLDVLDETDDFFLVCADTVVEAFPLEKFYNFHRDTGNQLTCVVVSPKSYGEYVVCKQNEMMEVVSSTNERANALSSTGIYLFRRDFLLQSLQRHGWKQRGDAPNLYRDIVIPAIFSRSVKTAGFLHEGYWDDIGTIERYFHNNMRISKGESVFLDPAMQEDSPKLKRCVYLTSIKSQPQ